MLSGQLKNKGSDRPALLVAQNEALKSRLLLNFYGPSLLTRSVIYQIVRWHA